MGGESLPAEVLGKSVRVEVGTGAESSAVQNGEHKGTTRSAPSRRPRGSAVSGGRKCMGKMPDFHQLLGETMARSEQGDAALYGSSNAVPRLCSECVFGFVLIMSVLKVT